MIRVDKMIPGGQSLGTNEDGKKVFFWNALPGETVTKYYITKNKSRYCEAVAEEYTDPSPHRVQPQDTCFLSTSPWQIMTYQYELQLKSGLIVELFREHKINIPTPAIITDGQDYHYRNKMEYALYWNNQSSQIELAFHERGSHRKIPIAGSSIERPEILQYAKKIVSDLNNHHEEARKYQSLLLRCNQLGKVSGGLYENNQPHPVFTPLSDSILGQTYNYSPNGFFQINLPVYEMALEEIKNHITTDEVLDLYAGVGTIGLSVARTHQLTLVECDKHAYSELVKNCEYINMGVQHEDEKSMHPLNHSIHPVLAKSEDVTNYIKYHQTVILDPPRAGCDRRLVEKLLDIKPATIIYLSCNPATQARDLSLLLDKYSIDIVKAYNFFPRTPHIENLVILSRKITQ